MSKTITKLLTLVLLIFGILFLSNNVYAREIKSVEELGKLIVRENPNAESAYVIGDYVFTTNHRLTIQDVMLAARTIKEPEGNTGYTDEDDIYKKAMNIFVVEPKDFDDEGKGIDWQISKNYVGTGEFKLDEQNTMNLQYIDYNKIYEEVNTNVLLEEAKGKITDNEFYGVEFTEATEQEKGILTFNIYDLFKKNSEISDTGLLADIVDIVKNDKVTSIAINEVTFGKDDVKDGAGEDSAAWKKFAVLLCKLTKKECDYQEQDEVQTEFKKITLGDLAAIQDELTLTINIDETVARSQFNNKEESYTIKFVYEPHATVDNSIPEDDIEDLKGTFKYTPEYNYTISGENGYYSIVEGGYVTEQEGVSGFGSETSKFYFTYCIEIDEDVREGVKIKIPKKENPESENDYNIYGKDDLTDGKLTVLMEVEKEEATKYRDIIIEVNGKPTKIRIDFTKLNLEKSSKFTIDKLENEDINESFEGWKEETGYDTTFEVDENDKTKVKVKGVLPIFNKEDFEDGMPLPKDALYYLGFVLKTELNTEEATNKINVEFVQDDEKKFTNDNFDKEKELYVLKYLDAFNEDGSPIDNSKKVFTVTLDWDGDGNDYAPYTITVDWSELKLQDASKESDFEVLTSSNGLNEKDKKDFEDWGFNFELDDISTANKTDEEGNVGEKYIKGTVKQQTLNAESGYESLEGYYIPLKIVFPKGDAYKDYKDTWTVKLYSKDDEVKEIKPTKEDYEQGYLAVLIQVDRNKDEIKYEIDYDGNDSYVFLPSEYKISYEDVEFKSANTVSYEYLDENGISQNKKFTVYEGENLTEDQQLELTNPAFHTFDYWFKPGKNTESIDLESLTTIEDEDVTLKAHWTLDTDAFVEAVVEDLNNENSEISENYANKFIAVKNNDNISFNVVDMDMLLNEMNETTIPGAIAYVLNKGEVKEITLEMQNKKVTFTKDGKDYEVNSISLEPDVQDQVDSIKGEIKKGAQALFEQVLESAEEMTLEKMALNKGEFTLEIGKFDETVKLTDESLKNTKYTFTFKTDKVNVASEEELIAALENTDIKNIYITQNFDITKQHEIKNQSVTITNSEDADITLTVQDTSKENVDSIFKVSATNAHIDNLKLNGAKKAVIVEETGELISDKLDVSGSTEAGIEVKGNGILTTTGLTYSGETYDKPAVMAEKDSKVTLKRADGKTAPAVTVEEITRYEDNEDGGNQLIDTKKEKEGYNNYYLEDAHGRIYTIEFSAANYQSARGVIAKRYCKYGERPLTPTKSEIFSDGFDADGYRWEIKGFALKPTETVEDNIYKEQNDFPEVTSDAKYYVIYDKQVKENAIEVGNAQELKNALTNGQYTEIYIKENTEIDFASEVDNLKIDKKVGIYGRNQQTSKIKVKNIEVTENAEGASISNLVIIGASTEETSNKDIITSKANNFSLYSVTIKNDGQKVENAIKYTGNGENGIVANVKWCLFYGTNIDNFINFDGTVADKTDIYLNSFLRETKPENKACDIIIKNVADDANIKITSNSFSSSEYAVKLSDAVANKTFTITFEYNGAKQKGEQIYEARDSFKLAAEVTDEHNDFSNCTLNTYGAKGLKIVYLKGEAETETNPIETGKNITNNTEKI